MNHNTQMGHQGAPRGVVFAATGPERYALIAEQAAKSLKATNPGLPVDLFTDAPRDMPVFDRVHVLENPWFRSKIDALLLSRFERTLYLDSDTMIVADISDVFDTLERFDVALAHEQQRNGDRAHLSWRHAVPRAFPQFNGGVIALRRSEATQTFLKEWGAAIRDHDIGFDQPSLRELLWASDLRIATLPPEYNLQYLRLLDGWNRLHGAPRIIHAIQFHRNSGRYLNSAEPLTDVLGTRNASKLPFLIDADLGLRTKAGRERMDVNWRTYRLTPAEQARRWRWILPRLPREIFFRTKQAGGNLLRRFGLR